MRNDWKYQLRNAWEYKLRNAWEYQQYRKASGYSGIKAALRCSSATCFAHKLRNAWEYQQCRKASGYSGIKAALRCSSATCLVHKPLKASLRSLVHGLKGRSQALDALSNDWEYPLRNAWKYKPRNAWEYQQYRKASGYSGIKAALRCSSATCFAHNASLHSFVHDCKSEAKLLKRYALIGNIRYIII